MDSFDSFKLLVLPAIIGDGAVVYFRLTEGRKRGGYGKLGRFRFLNGKTRQHKKGEGANPRFYLYQIQDLEIREILTPYTLSQGLSCKYKLMSINMYVSQWV